ncbi:MAG TPA: LiaF domain-containing protein [Chitinophagaceae bacterium]|nr:LiaF domain-containing protein [Chitinophagaceae bacterium]
MEQNRTSIQKPVSKKWIGLFLVTAGLLLIAYRLNTGIPDWLVSWPMAVIAIGLLVGIYHRFKNLFWLIPVFWGGFLMAEVQIPELNLGDYAGAVSLILVGLFFIYIKRARGSRAVTAFDSNEGPQDVTTILGHTRRSVVTSNFKRFNAVCVMGNTEIDFNAALVEDTAVIDVTLVMGAAKLTMPANWIIKNEINPVMGAVEDRRRTPAAGYPAASKTVVLRGTVFMSAIDITDRP